MADTLEQIIAAERDRLTQRRSEIMQQQGELSNQLTEIDREFAAVAAYEAVKKGKTVTIARGVTGHRAGSRAPRGQRQQQIIDALNTKPEGMGRADILEALGVKGDKSGAQSVSNALNNMKKANKITSTDGKYTVL